MRSGRDSNTLPSRVLGTGIFTNHVKTRKPHLHKWGFYAVWTGLEPATFPSTRDRHFHQPFKNKKAPLIKMGFLCGLDGTRTRDLLRDRQAF